MAQCNGSIARIRKEGYGFINPLDGSKDVFFHASSLIHTMLGELEENDCVNFDVEDGLKGPIATNIARDHSVSRNFMVPDDPLAARFSSEAIEIPSHNIQHYAEVAKVLDNRLIKFFKDNPNDLHEMDEQVAAGYLQQLYAEIASPAMPWSTSIELKRYSAPNFRAMRLDSMRCDANECQPSSISFQNQTVSSPQLICDWWAA